MQFYQKLGFTRTIAFFSLLIGLFVVHLGERVALREGKGWDGVTFVYYTQHFDSLIQNRLINTKIEEPDLTLTHKVNRFFPSMVVHYALRTVQIPINTPNIIQTFAYYNLFCFVLASVFIGIIGQKFDLQEKSKWLLWFMLLFNFAVVKRSFYEPALTDLSAICLGIGLIASWASDSWKGLLGLIILAIIGAFTWQPITIYAYILLLFPRNIKLIEHKNQYLNWFFPLFFGSLFLFKFLTDYDQFGIRVFSQVQEIYYGQVPMYQKGLFVSAALATFYTAGYFGFLLKNCSFKNLIYFLKPNLIFRIIPVIVLYFSVNYLNSLVTPNSLVSANDVTSGTVSGLATAAVQNPFSILLSFIYSPLALHSPLGFLFMHAAFFGVVFIIATFFYNSFTQTLRKEGGIAFVLIFLSSYQSSLLNPQSRIGTALFPFIALLAVLVADRQRWSNGLYIFLILLNIFASKIWLPVGDFSDPAFSWVRWYSSFGLWANWFWTFLIGFLFCLVGSILLVFVYKDLILNYLTRWKNIIKK